MRQIALISGSFETSEALYKQLKDFIPSTIHIEVYVSNDGIEKINDCEVQVFSSKALYDEVVALGVLNDKVPKIIGKRTINYSNLDQIVSIPDHENVLLVNDLKSTAEETRAAMEEIGLNHMNLQLYYPGAPIVPSDYKIAITPGELECVPIEVETIINIGARIFDFTTIAKLLTHLSILDISSGSFSRMYLEKIIKIAKGLATSRKEVVQLNTHLERVIDSFNEGVLMYDQQHKIVVFNDVLKQILKVKKYMYIGNTVERVIQNKKILVYLMDDEETLPLNISLDGNDYVINKFRIEKNELQCASFKSLREHHLTKETKAEALRKGYVAKYDLEDIIGQSASVKHVREVILKLGKTDMNILIQGESGTGKELTASAIHNHSTRKDEPFLAVNFSALPDDLIESELFGYSDGAFTGAKKGGKKGLFEEANGGTIFLDEIGDVSLKVQLRLLRVLEEKEIMPIGANEIRPIDVRIIAATNKDLGELVTKKLFREDLYYRLKMGFVHLKPLRERLEDVAELSTHIAQGMATSAVTFDLLLLERLSSYHWPGNIRELKNTIIYMLAVRTSEILTVEDLPAGEFFSKQMTHINGYDNFVENKSVVEISSKRIFLTDEEKVIFELIYNYTKNDQTISRQSLAQGSKETAYSRTENQIRRIVQTLKEKGLVEIYKGRMGIQLSKEGYAYYE